jgi:aryl-alcohol dehydrogenase-like predicted oxidoreductase
MQPTADRHDAALAEVALNWARQKEFVSTCVVGAQKRVRVEGNVRCLQWELSAEETAELNKALETIF